MVFVIHLFQYTSFLMYLANLVTYLDVYTSQCVSIVQMYLV